MLKGAVKKVLARYALVLDAQCGPAGLDAGGEL
jgi:hypothetical protein